MYKVLISDAMSNVADQIFNDKGIEVDVITGLSEQELINIIPEYDGLLVCLLYTSPSPRDRTRSRMPSSA